MTLSMATNHHNMPDFAALDKYPWLLRVVYLFGIPAAISIYLVWLMSARVEGNQREMLDILKAHELNSQYNLKSNGEQIDRLDKIFRLTQALCVNAAEDSAERSRCFAIGNVQQ